MKKLASSRVFDGELCRYQHDSDVTQSSMTFAIYLPPRYQDAGKISGILYWLSGLTCTDENFCQKSGAFRVAAELGLIIVCPDTSPRDTGIPNEKDAFNYGEGAGFYVNATQSPWSDFYRMYDYVVTELPELAESYFELNCPRSIAGHSMGGHGALICALRNPGRYQSVSAFAPIVNPMQCSLGQTAFSLYLGEDVSAWQQYDACELIRSYSGEALPILIDQGTEDEFLADELNTPNIEKACDESRYPLTLNMRAGYDHGYYFVSTFIEDHLKYHVAHLIKGAIS